MLVVPDLTDTVFTRVTISVEPCEFDPQVEVPEAVFENLARSIPSEGYRLRCGCASFCQDRPCLLSFAINAKASVEIGIENEWFTSAQVKGGIGKDGHPIPPIEQLDASDFSLQVHEKLSALYGCKLFGGSECHFKLDVDQLPRGGIVRRGIAAQARFEADTLRLVGAQFAINDDNWHRLSWFIDPGEAGAPDTCESIEGRVEHVSVKEIGPRFLADIVESAQALVDRYILESSELAVK